MTGLKWTAIALALTVILSIAATGFGRWHWNRETAAMRARLEAARQSLPVGVESQLAFVCAGCDSSTDPIPDLLHSIR